MDSEVNHLMSARYQETRKIHAISKLYQKGKTQIPSEVRRSLGLADGHKILWIVEGGKWVIEKA
jgi:bifunctional DNA-binding transcriptional regulator/antitoxin component of YhaV-PrlF toxin-antitoxin module